MRILAVDDEYIQLKLLENAIQEAVADCELKCFQKSTEALKWAENMNPEIAFLDMEMPTLSGIELGKELKKKNPEINLIFISGYFYEYVKEALPLHFSGYLEKPVTVELIELEMRNLRFPLKKKTSERRLQVTCFGEFEVYLDGKALIFGRSKTKEMFAYLIDRKGKYVNGNALCAILYGEDDSKANNKGNLRKCVMDLRATLKEAGMGEVFQKGFDSYALNTELISCDYYDWEKNDPGAIHAFRGEYMSQYSWAESTLARLLYTK